MVFEEAMWEIIRKKKFGCEWELLPSIPPQPIISVVDSEKEIEKILTMSRLFDIAYDKGVITKRGPWYYFDGKTIGQGNKARELSDELKEQIYESISD